MAKFANVVQAKAEMSMTADQLAAAKEEHVQKVLSKWNPDSWDIDPQALKVKIKELHKYMAKCEEIKYDAEQRLIAQEYDLKELNERQRQVARNEARKKGLNPDEAGGKYPPKVQVIARGERQIDRRNFKERRQVFDKKNAIPHFPNTPPPEQKLEKVIAQDKHADEEEDEDEEEE